MQGEIISNQPFEHYKRQGYVKVGNTRVQISRDRVNADFIYEYVVKEEIRISFNESMLADEFVQEMKKYISRYGEPKLSRVAFFGTKADSGTSGKYFDDHDIIKRDNYPGRDEPRFAFNWQGKKSVTWFTQTVDNTPVFQISERSSPTTSPPKFRLRQQVVFHTTADEYLNDPEVQHEIVEVISWEECSNDNNLWYLVANKSLLRDTDWLYRVKGNEYYFKEEELANFFDSSVDRDFLESVDYRTLGGQEMSTIKLLQDISFTALLRKNQKLIQEIDLDIFKNLQLFDGITCGVEQVNGPGLNWYRVKFARLLPMIRYRKTPRSTNIKIAGCYHVIDSPYVRDDMIEAVYDGSKWTVKSEVVMMLCLRSSGLRYIQLKSGFDDVTSFKHCLPFNQYRDEISERWLDDCYMRGKPDNERYREWHSAVMPAIFYEISFLHSIEQRMVQIDTQESRRRAKQLLQGPQQDPQQDPQILKERQIKSIVENGLKETIATLYDQPTEVQRTAIGTRKPSYYVVKELNSRLDTLRSSTTTKTFDTRMVCKLAYKKFYKTPNQLSEMRPTLMREAFKQYLLNQAEANLPRESKSGESKTEERLEPLEPLEAEETITFLKLRF